MKRYLMFALALSLAACGGEDPEPEPVAHVSMSDDVMVWANEFGQPADLELVDEGVAVSREKRTVYALDCARGEELVKEGAEFGPVSYDEGGDGSPGFTNVCRP